MNEKRWSLVGISGIDISSRIKKIMGGVDTKEVSISHALLDGEIWKLSFHSLWFISHPR